MEASGRGDDLTVLTLLRLGATPDITVAPNHPSCAGWTALSFAVSNNHYSVVKVSLVAVFASHKPTYYDKIHYNILSPLCVTWS